MKKKVAKGMYLVSWKDIGEHPEFPLPMRAFGTYEEAECYVLGCADVICVASKKELDIDKVINDFFISDDN